MYYPLIRPTYINVLDALEELGTCVPWAEYPTLTEADALKALYKSRLVDVLGRPPDQYSIWRPGTVYVLGDHAVPTLLNGHYYTVTVAGTSGATEPIFPTTSGATVGDNGITWQEAGQALWYGAFDINYAASLLWRQKAGLTAHMTQQSVDGQSFNPQQLQQQFMAMSKYYSKRRGVRSIPYRSAMGHLRSPYVSTDYFDWTAQ